MTFNFDGLDEYRIPVLTLYNPQKNVIGTIGYVNNITPTLSFNQLSELTFDVLFDCPLYNEILKTRLIKIEGYNEYSWFEIKEENEKDDGSSLRKEVKCISYENTLNRFEVNLAIGTYKFYDPIDNSNTLLGLFSKQTGWDIKYVSSELMNKYRTFDDISDAQYYSFLMNDVCEAYYCIFHFDTDKETISAYTQEEAVTQTDIFLSLDNLIKQIEVTTTDDEICTGLSVRGDNTLDISQVNPMGTPIIYNFNYYKNINWMTSELVNGLTNWENAFRINQPIYSNVLTNLKSRNSQLIVYRSELVDLQTAYTILETIRTERIVQGITDLSDITNQINENLTLQENKQSQINNTTISIEQIQNQLAQINSNVQFKNFLNSNQLEELQKFINIQTYQNENFGVLSSMSPVEVQELAQDLYNQGVEVLSKVSQPCYTFEVDSINFLFIKEFEEFIKHIKLGAFVNLNTQKEIWVQPVLLSLKINYSNPLDFKLIFSNKLKLGNGIWTLSDLQYEQSKASGRVGLNNLGWNEAASKTSEITEYMNNALNLTEQAIQTPDQEMIINQFGLLARQLLDDGTYSPEQFKMIHNLLVFTRDSWKSVITAIGKIKNPNGEGYTYGIAAPLIVGDFVASNSLSIRNENNSFIVDGNGVTLRNASFVLETNNNLNRIILDPENGIKIQYNNNDTWQDVFYVDETGNLMATSINVVESTTGGFNVGLNSISSIASDLSGTIINLKSDGTGRLSGINFTPTTTSINATELKIGGNQYAPTPVTINGITYNLLATTS